MAHQDRNNAFVASNIGAAPSGEYLPFTRNEPISGFELKAGSIISGVLMGGINSDMPGTVLGQTSENVYDTATGKYLLIPQGARMIGVYDSHVVYGQHRVLVVWQRIIYPDGSSLNIGGMLGGDQAGYAGFKQKVDNHYSRLVGAALLASVFTAAGKMATQNDRDNQGNETAAAEAVMQTMTSLGAQLAEKNMNVAPTLRILPGYRFSIVTTKDIAFAEPYVPRRR
jgi:type IV secretion system protein VirB10